jgi:hypothetical protein
MSWYRNISERTKKTWDKLSLKQRLVFLFSIPLLICSLITYLVFGNPISALIKMFELRGNPNKTKDAVTSLSYIWTLLITIYGIGITAFFSYLVWKVSERSLQVSEDIKNLEENRDSELCREQALIVYYDLQRGITYLRDLYISTVINKQSPNPKRLYFSNDWIKNVATLRNNLSSEQLAKIYDIYNDFFTIQSMLDSESSGDSKNEISSIVKLVGNKMFADFIPLPLLKEFDKVTPDDLLEIDIYIILQQIYMLTFPPHRIEISPNNNTTKLDGINHYSILNKENEWQEEAILYTPSGNEKARGYFVSGHFTTGKVYGYKDSQPFYQIEYLKTKEHREIQSGFLKDPNTKNSEDLYFLNGEFLNGIIHEGITTSYTDNGIITYRGTVVKCLYEGQGFSFDPSTGKVLFRGTYKDGLKVKGTLFENDKEIFEGEFREGRPWIGKANKLSLSQYMVKDFTGDIIEGKPFHGSGYKFKVNERGETFEDIESLEAHYIESIEKYEENTEYIDQEINDQIRRDHLHWDEYIFTDWNEGNAIARENKATNIEVIGY